MRRRVVLPLVAWVCLAVGLTGIAVLVTVLAVVGINDGAHRSGFAAGAAVAVLMSLGAGLLVRPIGRTASSLTAQASADVLTGSALGEESGIAVHTKEFAALSRSIISLQRRTALAEAVADQASRNAETTSAGMFELLSGLVAAEEATRGQLSAELHDSVAQTLMRAKSELNTRGEHSEAWERIRTLVDDAEEEIRAAMARARPPELRDGDLAGAVEGLRREMASRYLLDVRLDWPEERHALPLSTAVAVYRFFQEALLNVVKHADVDEVDAGLSVNEGTLVATVRDEGPGFVPSSIRSEGGRHVGLGLLRERARLAGGKLVIESVPGAGTTVRLVMPVAPHIGLGLAHSPGSRVLRDR